LGVVKHNKKTTPLKAGRQVPVCFAHERKGGRGIKNPRFQFEPHPQGFTPGQNLSAVRAGAGKAWTLDGGARAKLRLPVGFARVFPWVKPNLGLGGTLFPRGSLWKRATFILNGNGRWFPDQGGTGHSPQVGMSLTEKWVLRKLDIPPSGSSSIPFFAPAGGGGRFRGTKIFGPAAKGSATNPAGSGRVRDAGRCPCDPSMIPVKTPMGWAGAGASGGGGLFQTTPNPGANNPKSVAWGVFADPWFRRKIVHPGRSDEAGPGHFGPEFRGAGGGTRRRGDDFGSGRVDPQLANGNTGQNYVAPSHQWGTRGGKKRKTADLGGGLVFLPMVPRGAPSRAGGSGPSSRIVSGRQEKHHGHPALQPKAGEEEKGLFPHPPRGPLRRLRKGASTKQP